MRALSLLCCLVCDVSQHSAHALRLTRAPARSAFDHFFACMDLPGADNGAPRSLFKDPRNHSAGNVSVTCGKAPYVCDGGTGYDTFAPKFGPGGNPHLYPYSPQSDANSGLNGAGSQAVEMFGPEQLPIKSAIVREFGVL